MWPAGLGLLTEKNTIATHMDAFQQISDKRTTALLCGLQN